MSEKHGSDSFIDRYWQVGLILFGLIFIFTLALFPPDALTPPPGLFVDKINIPLGLGVYRPIAASID